MRKKIISGIAVIITALFVMSCSADHSIRVKNSYSSNFNEVKINSTSYGAIKAGATTDYKPVDEGSFTISGTTENGQSLSGSGSVKGAGTHKWTLTITSAGGVSIAED